MNFHRPISKADVDAAMSRLEAAIAPPAVRHSEPFAKRQDGKARRKARRQRIADKLSWLNS